MKRGWSVAERFVGQTADDGIANDPVATAPTAPVISSVGPAFQNRLVPVMFWPVQVRSRVSSRQNVVRSGVEKVGLATSRSFGWIV
ncbi:Uncharacterised protein [Brevibacterium iodinum]|nr:Uncharacterised protein [Brevibacterium iodinum]